MSRAVIALLALAPSVAAAEEYETYEEPLPEIGESPGGDVGERELAASLGVAIGAGGLTPGGLRVAGSYLYQLSDLDWFDGGVAFTFGGGGAACFRDRADEVVCDHGAASGVATDFVIGVRRFFAGDGGFRPWVRPSVALRVARFGGDDLTGAGVIAGAAGGVRVRVLDWLAVGGHAALELGGAWFGGDVGPTGQAGLTIGADVEFLLP